MLKHGWTLKTWCQWEAVRKDYILYDFTKRKVQDRQIQRDTKWVTVQGWVWGEWEMNANGMEFLWEAMKYSCCLITKSCLTLCDPMEWSVLGFPVLHYLPEFAQTHVHWVTHFFCWHLWLLLTKHNFSSKEQASFYFVAAVTIHSDFGAQEYKICYCFHLTHLFAMKWCDHMPWS